MKKVAVVSGGSRGIGAAVCRAFGEAGYTVIINYKESRGSAEALAAELRLGGCNAEACCCDVRDGEAVSRMFEEIVKKYGRVDVLVNNAGVCHYGLLTDVSETDWDLLFDTNVKGVFHMCKAALKDMVWQKSGAIINISSMWGICGASCEAAYSASKAAVIGLTKALAKELGPSGIRVNCVAPGAVATDMMKDLSEETIALLKEETPLGVIGSPEQIAEAVLFLASEKAAFLTGQVISPNGGLVI